MDALMQDVRYALRMLRKSPGFTTVAILSLALGIGASTTMFSVVDAVDFRALPYPHAERLVVLDELAPAASPSCRPDLECRAGTTPAAAADFREQSHVFDAMALYRMGERRLRSGDESEEINTAEVSGEFFTMFGARALLGRGFVSSDLTGGEPVIVLSYELWRSRFGGDPKVIGSRVQIIDEHRRRESAYTVVGVMPRHFAVLGEDSWTPITSLRGAGAEPRNFRLTRAIARLAPGVTIEQGRAAVRTVAARLAAAYPESNKGWSADIRPFDGPTIARYWTPRGGTNTGRGRFVLFAVVTVVLLIATINVAALFLVRGGARSVELSVRSALGASRARLVRQLVVECLCVALAGGALGVLLAAWGVSVARSVFYLDYIGITTVGIDQRVLLFALAVSLLAGVAAGLAPSLQLSRIDLGSSLRERTLGGSAGGRTPWMQHALVVAEVACALVLLTGAGLLSKELLRLRRDEPGYDPRGLYVLTAAFPRTAERPDVAQHRLHAARARDDVARVPGVVSAAATARDFRSVQLPGRTEPLKRGDRPEILDVTPDFFRTMRIPILRGRGLDPSDREGSTPVVVVDETIAARFWPGESPIGKTLVFPDTGTGPSVATVVGLAGRAKFYISPLIEPSRGGVYAPLAQAPMTGTTVWVYARLDGNAARALPTLRSVIHEITGSPVDKTDIVSKEESIAEELRQQRFDANALGGFALFGLMLAAMGIYGVVAYAVTQRTREFGIRIALGAEARSVLALVTALGVRLAVAGVLVGLAGAYVATRVLRSLLVGTSPSDPFTFVWSALVLVLVTLAATLVPARRATKVDPMTALRAE